MSYLLFPGRHLLNTAFQSEYLRGTVQMPLSHLDFLDGHIPTFAEPISEIVFAITSSNQEHSRYNPIPFHVRAIGVDRFARSLEVALDVSYRIVGIPHYAPTPRFAGHVLKEIEEQTEGELVLTPTNCVVLCSTPSVIKMYHDLGFSILPAELGVEGKAPEIPIVVLQKMAAAGDSWADDRELRQLLAPATYDLWHDFPHIPQRIIRLWRDPLLNEDGGLTADRDYDSYAYAMSNSAIIELKYQDIQEAIVPGKIVDEGCGDGALLAQVAKGFPDSDLIGIEITGELISRCRERQRAGDFGESFIHFHQRNIAQPIFTANSIDTTICNSTLHELWSYGHEAEAVRDYLSQKYAQTAAGGRLVIRDVVGPEHKEQSVAMWLATDDGSANDVFLECKDREKLMEHLSGLSTYGRFLRFARDFLAEQRKKGRRGPESRIEYQEMSEADGRMVVLTLRSAVEFMSKKDYVNNWSSEMNEEFAFWSFSEWRLAMRSAGFHLIEAPADPHRGSRAYTNPWIIKNRYEGKVRLFSREADGGLQPLPYPPTNMLLFGEKRRNVY